MKLKKKCTPRLGFSRTRIEARSYTNPEEFFNQNQSTLMLTPLSFAFPENNKGQIETPPIAKTAKSFIKNLVKRPRTQQSLETSKNNTITLTYEQYGRLASKKLITPNYFQRLADINDHILNRQAKIAQINLEQNAKKTIFRQLFDKKDQLGKKMKKRQYFKQTNPNNLEEKIKTIATCDLSALSSHVILQKLEDKWQAQNAEEMKKCALAFTEESQFGSHTFGSHREDASAKSNLKFSQEGSDRVKGKQSISSSVDSKLKPFFDRIFGPKCDFEKQSNQYEFNSEKLMGIRGAQKRRNADFSNTRHRKRSSFKPMLQWKSH